MPAAASSSGSRFTCVVEAGWVTSVSGPPSEVASWQIRVDSTKRPAGLEAAGQVEGEQPPGVAHLPLGQLVLRVRGQARVAHLGDAGVTLEHLGERAAAVSVCWRRRTPSVRRPRRPFMASNGEALAPCSTAKPQSQSSSSRGAGDHAEGGVVVAADRLGGRVDDQVDAVVERALAERRGEGRVDHLHRPGDRAEPVEVDQVEPRVGRGLGEQQHRSCPGRPPPPTPPGRCRRRR